MKPITLLLLICLAVGCGVTSPTAPGRPRDVKPLKPKAETVLSIVADNITSDSSKPIPTLYSTTDDVMRTANRLLESKSITVEQHAKIKALIGVERRKLTQQDADAIRGL